MKSITLIILALLSGCATAPRHEPMPAPKQETQKRTETALPTFPTIEPHEWRSVSPELYQKLWDRENLWHQMARKCGKE